MNRLCTGITLVLSLLITLSFIPVASATMNDEYIMEISIDENHVSFADHNGTAEGNWISLSGGEAFNIPEPFTFTYNGINSKNAIIKGRNVTVELNVENNTDHVITYPYDTHQMYVAESGLDDVSFTFHGSDHFANKEVDVYLFNSSIVDLKHILDDLLEGNTASAQAIYDNSQGSADVLDANGDMSMTYNDMNPGSYSIMIIHTDDITEENILLSATAFEVLDYTANLETTRNSNNVQLDISIEDAPDETYTYGAILIKESAYTTDVRVEFDGTQDGFDVLMNGMPIIEGIDLVGMSKDDIDGAELEECLTDIFGADNISIVYEAVYGTNATLYADTTGLSEGDYIVFAGVTSDHDMVAFEQDEMYIIEKPGDGSFVSGGGWITSPAGAYTEDPELTGKVIFGFVSKYAKGASVPTGSTQIQFRETDLNFHSDEYQLLVITDSKAQYNGTGTINGEGDYGFILTAIDGDIKGDGIDKIRIKIWDRSSDAIIYDNMIDAEDCADPTTAIGGGSIKIHKRGSSGGNSGGNSGGSSGGSSGGGGSGATGEAYENIASKEVKTENILGGLEISYTFDEEPNAIEYIKFSALKNNGRVSTTIEVLEDKSAMVDESAPGVVYSNLNIWVGKAGFATEDNIANPVIGFSVAKAWLTENEINEESIALYHYSESKWNNLNSIKIGEDDSYIYFEAKTPGFSPFAITGETTSVGSEDEGLTGTDANPLTKEVESLKTSYKGENRTTSADAKTSTGNITVLLSFATIIGSMGYIKRDDISRYLKKK